MDIEAEVAECLIQVYFDYTASSNPPCGCFSFLLKALFLKVAKTAAAHLVTETSLKTEQEIKTHCRQNNLCFEQNGEKNTHCTGNTSPYKYDKSLFFLFTPFDV